MRNILFLLLITLFSCKKEKKPDMLIPEGSARFKILTGHQWSMTHEYIDSTAYAKNHLNEWPLTSTQDFMNYYDTCSWDSKLTFLSDGRVKLIKSPSCSSSISENVGNWKLTNNDNDFIIVGQDTLHIIELNQTNFKMYYVSEIYHQQQLVGIQYVMWTFETR